MPRILVLDEHAIYRTGLCSLICARVPCVEVIEANSLVQGLSQLRNSIFDLVLVGVGLSSFGPLNPLKAACEASPATRFAIISCVGHAGGYSRQFGRRISWLHFEASVRHRYSCRHHATSCPGEFMFLRPLLRRLPKSAMGQGAATLPTLSTDVLKLTKRQREVLSLLTRGKSNKEIARALDIAEATTKIHMAALVRVLGVRNRTEAAYKAAKLAVLPELNSPELGPGFDGLAAVALRSAA